MNPLSFWQKIKVQLFVAISVIISLIISLAIAMVFLPFLLIFIVIFLILVWKSKRELSRRRAFSKQKESSEEGDIIEVTPLEVKSYTSTRDEHLALLIEHHQKMAKGTIIEGGPFKSKDSEQNPGGDLGDHPTSP